MATPRVAARDARQSGWSIGKSLRRRLALRRNAELFADRSGGVADFLDRRAYLLLRDAESMRPVLELIRLMQIDLAAVRLLPLGQAVH